MCLYDTLYIMNVYIYILFKQLSHVYKNKHIPYSYYPPFVISAFFLQLFFLCSPKNGLFLIFEKKTWQHNFHLPKNLEFIQPRPWRLFRMTSPAATTARCDAWRIPRTRTTTRSGAWRPPAIATPCRWGVGKGIRGRRFTSKREKPIGKPC